MSLLEEAAATVGGARAEDYGSTLEPIAAMWSVIFGHQVSYQQVAQCMVAVKLVRLNASPDHRDSWVDIAGYAALWELSEKDLK